MTGRLDFRLNFFPFPFLLSPFGYKANDDIIYVNFPFKIMRSLRSMFFAIISGEHSNGVFGSLWIFWIFNSIYFLCLSRGVWLIFAPTNTRLRLKWKFSQTKPALNV